MMNTSGVDYVIAADTDSIYINMEEMVKALDTNDELVIVDTIDKFCEQIIQPKLNIWFQELADYMGAYQQKMQMKRETIASKGIWRGKKMYILNAWNVEGVQYSEPKLKISGIEAVRSSTPHVCRENIKKALSLIMNKSENDLQEFIAKFKDEFMTLPFEDVAFPRGINGMDEYKDSSTIYRKGTPVQVKGALIFNNMLKKYDLKTIQPIQNGDKVKFAYLKMPNPVLDTVISVSDDYLPTEFNLDKYIDRELQFNKAFLVPITSITSVIGWDVEKRATLEDFFS